MKKKCNEEWGVGLIVGSLNLQLEVKNPRNLICIYIVALKGRLICISNLVTTIEKHFVLWTIFMDQHLEYKSSSVHLSLKPAVKLHYFHSVGTGCHAFISSEGHYILFRLQPAKTMFIQLFPFRLSFTAFPKQGKHEGSLKSNTPQLALYSCTLEIWHFFIKWSRALFSVFYISLQLVCHI